MGEYVPSQDLLPRIDRGETVAIGRLITRAEGDVPEARDALANVYKRSGKAHVIGITGVPGSGKSTLVAAMTAKLVASGKRVGVIAVDPSSPYSGGSILGDRIRMTELANNPNVYIRSMATHGEMGGVARSTLATADILDVAGFDVIIIETVGVGQDEVEIVKASHTTVVVSAPGLGDDIQAIKAGVLEIADMHLVSKCDRPDANKTLTDLKQMLTLNAAKIAQSAWRTPVIGVSSLTGMGLDEFIAALEGHRKISVSSEGDKRRLEIAAFRLEKTAKRMLLEEFDKATGSARAELAHRLSRKEGDPYSFALDLVRSVTQ